MRRGVKHFRIHRNGGQMRFLPMRAHTIERIEDYLSAAGHGEELNAPLFTAVRKMRDGKSKKTLTGHAIYKDVVQKYTRQIGIEARWVNVHGLRATAATSALDHEADIAKVQEWLGYSSISTTRLYDRRKTKPDESPTFKVSY